MRRILVGAAAALSFFALAATVPAVLAPVLVPPALAADSGSTVRPTDMAQGKADAPVTVIEYASLTCPHCARFNNDVFPQVKKDFIDTGKVRWVFRDYPLDAVALHGALLAHCGGPDSYFKFMDVLFADQKNWVVASDPDAALVRYGQLGGLSAEKAKACLADKSLSDLVLANHQLGDDAGVDSTPTFFINGKKVTGEKSYAEFAALLAH